MKRYNHLLSIIVSFPIILTILAACEDAPLSESSPFDFYMYFVIEDASGRNVTPEFRAQKQYLGDVPETFTADGTPRGTADDFIPVDYEDYKDSTLYLLHGMDDAFIAGWQRAKMGYPPVRYHLSPVIDWGGQKITYEVDFTYAYSRTPGEPGVSATPDMPIEGSVNGDASKFSVRHIEKPLEYVDRVQVKNYPLFILTLPKDFVIPERSK